MLFRSVSQSRYAVFGSLSSLSEEVKVDFEKPQFSQILDVLKQKTFLMIFVMMFFIFFVFQALLNFVPFQLKALSSTMGYGKVGMMYAGYIIGFIISIRVLGLIRVCGSEIRAVFLGIGIFFLGVNIFHVADYWVMFGGMFIVCAGFFIIHSVASPVVHAMRSAPCATASLRAVFKPNLEIGRAHV